MKNVINVSLLLFFVLLSTNFLIIDAMQDLTDEDKRTLMNRHQRATQKINGEIVIIVDFKSKKLTIEEALLAELYNREKGPLGHLLTQMQWQALKKYIDASPEERKKILTKR